MMEKKKLVIIISGVLVLLIPLMGFILKKNQSVSKVHQEHETHGEEKSDEHKMGGEEKKEVKLTTEQLDRFDIQTILLTESHFQHRISFPAQIALNENTLTHVVASVPGTVKEIFKGLGEPTKAGEALATLQSSEMAEVKSAYVSAYKNLGMQKELFERDERLWKKRIKAEIQFIQVKNLYENAKINLEQSKQKLLALSMTESQIQKLPEQTIPLNIYTIDSPIDGKVIERHITLGEVISGNKQVFVIANLDTVWVNLAIPAEDLPKIKKNQKVEVTAHQGEKVYSGIIMYVSPVINEDSRSGRAIIQLDNKKGELHPGDFVKAQVLLNGETAILSLPNPAIQRIEGKSVVFVKGKNHLFEARSIDIRGSDKAEFVEVVGGLAQGEEIVIKNTFFLKAELGKSEAEHAH
jgi:cobalt-zinc-cadmium efflux system membrane fusion protein